MIDYNKYFSIENHIGEIISEEEFQVLMADKKIYTTKCRMIGIDAAKAMNMDLSEFDLDERTYGGHIIADSLQEAEQIAVKRGFGEEIEGWLCGVIPFDSPFINPCDTSPNKN